jgi:hypothetical protein
MGVVFPSDSFEEIDLLKKMEKARNNLMDKNNQKQTNLVVQHDNDLTTTLSLEWHIGMMKILF